MANKIVDKIKESLNTTPVAFRWLLLIAAFIVVLILLFLLLSKPKQNAVNVVPENRDVKLIIAPESASFVDTKIGNKAKQTFKINATYNVVIDSVALKDKIDGFSITKSCVNTNVKSYDINKSIPCLVDVAFSPNNETASGDATIVISWHDKKDSRDAGKKVSNIVIPFSAQGASQPAQKPVQEKIPEPAPVEATTEDDIDASLFDDVDYDDSDDADSMPDLTDTTNVFKAAPAPTPAPVQKQRAPEKCSDFAMPGYSTSGAQIGWIKPSDGRYEFHPFSDKDCKNPTGIYNPDTGIITSIDGKGKKIGTDADHIGWTGDITSAPALKSKHVTARVTDSSTDKIGGMGDFKGKFQESGAGMELIENKVKTKTLTGSGEAESVYSTRPYDRTFILRQFKPIPATIVSEVRADPSVYDCNANGVCTGGSGIPVRATVDRNVYSDNGRTIIIPTGTLLMGYLTGELPGPYKSVGRMKIKWYQFIRPDGVEFNFMDENQDPYSADAQGRVGVPGYGSTDYVEQMVMPLITAMIPAAVNMIAPIADTFVNQIDLDNNTVVQSGTVRSSELAKNEVITAWNKVAQKLIVDALDNTTPPFSIAAGTRITVYSPVDLVATCGDGTDEENPENAGKKCAFHAYGSETRRSWAEVKGQMKIKPDDSSWVGQVRSFDLSGFCEPDSKGVMTVRSGAAAEIAAAGHDYRTVLAYCQAQNYQGKTQAKYEAYYDNKLQQGIQGVDSDGNKIKLATGTKEYNQQVLGLEYDDEGNIKNPFEKPVAATPATESVGSLDCDGAAPDQYGCCPGETYTDMGDQGFNCCPDSGGDCFPPLDLN
ncbi:MAG: hypothetical protein IKM94_04665 [Alphaproteobacteria bacterium]|nr:hypothetical protein [Alphaproteobacteria bacterium]